MALSYPRWWRRYNDDDRADMGKLSFTVDGSDDPRGIHDDPERARTGPRFGSDEFNRLDVLAEPIGDDQVLETEAVESAVHPEVEIDLRDSPRDEFMSLLTGRLAVVTGANSATSVRRRRSAARRSSSTGSTGPSMCWSTVPTCTCAARSDTARSPTSTSSTWSTSAVRSC